MPELQCGLWLGWMFTNHLQPVGRLATLWRAASGRAGYYGGAGTQAAGALQYREPITKYTEQKRAGRTTQVTRQWLAARRLDRLQ